MLSFENRFERCPTGPVRPDQPDSSPERPALIPPRPVGQVVDLGCGRARWAAP
ncbi:MAG TPA: hypothetical protein P5526_19050 [Anaerolineae bacterium]|nr:hypothetical protein [Anaerolineae bacterium]MCB0223207.1 hypothetical protein [Anaerolineae bacterium]MCB9104652.1 hypothetical protein [Anaerolineales bacterium]HRV94262.1 hypothetical protein [Anaerolineae bacterium]